MVPVQELNYTHARDYGYNASCLPEETAMLSQETPLAPAASAAPVPPTFATYEAFLAWAFNQRGYTEWAKGETIVYMTTSAMHQALVYFLSSLLGAFAQLLGLGKLYLGPMQMKLAESGREPDIFFVSTANLDRVTAKRLNGPADLVIEIVSDESVTRDREDKFYEYEAAGIPEYWILDPRPNRQRAYFYQLDEHGHYQPVALDDAGRYHSHALSGFWLEVAWLWQAEKINPTVKLMQVLGKARYLDLLEQAEKAD